MPTPATAGFNKGTRSDFIAVTTRLPLKLEQKRLACLQCPHAQ